jgi:hypothetical protein
MAKFLAKAVDVVSQSVSFNLGNGLKIVAELESMSQPMITQLALHGLSQKIGDAAAGFSKAEDFRGAFGAMQAVLDGLVQDVWTTRGSGNSDLIEALVELGMASDAEDGAAMVGALDEATMKAVQAHPEVKAVVRRLQAERAAEAAKAAIDSAPDLSALLRK